MNKTIKELERQNRLLKKDLDYTERVSIANVNNSVVFAQYILEHGNPLFHRHLKSSIKKNFGDLNVKL